MSDYTPFGSFGIVHPDNENDICFVGGCVGERQPSGIYICYKHAGGEVRWRGIEGIRRELPRTMYINNVMTTLIDHTDPASPSSPG
jgi:hypothetical protein